MVCSKFMVGVKGMGKYNIGDVLCVVNHKVCKFFLLFNLDICYDTFTKRENRQAMPFVTLGFMINNTVITDLKSGLGNGCQLFFSGRFLSFLGF